MTFKQIFQLERILCTYLLDILKRLLANVCFNASFMCFFRFVAMCLIFNDSGCWTQRCGLLSRIQLRVTDQSWQTGPNESVLHFEVVFVVCWHQSGKLIQVVYITISLILHNYTKSRLKLVYWWHWKKSSNWKSYLECIYMIFWKDCLQRFVSMLHLCLGLNLLHFVVLLTIYAVERNVVVYYVWG